MAIAYKSQGAGAGTETNGATLNVPCPATVDANDILIGHIIHTGTTTAPSTPSGWSLLYGPANVGTTATARHWVFGKLADGTEDGTNINFGTAGGTNGRSGRIYSFSGYISGTLADVVPAASFSDIPHATDPQGPSVTTTVAGARAVALKCQDDNNTKVAITGMSGGTWAEAVAEYSNSTWGPQGIVLAIDTCVPTADPGTVSGGAEVSTNDEAGTIGFEIRPNAPSANPTRGQISFAEVEVPLVPTRGRVSFAELETPLAPTRGRVSFAEFETPIAPTRGRVSWVEMETPNAPGSPTRGLLSFAELEAPFQATRGRVAWAELETPLTPTRGRLSWAELEAPLVPTRGRASFAEMEVPGVPTRGRISFVELEISDEYEGPADEYFMAYRELKRCRDRRSRKWR